MRKKTLRVGCVVVLFDGTARGAEVIGWGASHVRIRCFRRPQERVRKTRVVDRRQVEVV